MKGFVSIAAPLHALTDKDVDFIWMNKCQEAFDGLKQHLTSSPVTAFPNVKLPFQLYMDASHCGLGAILADV